MAFIALNPRSYEGTPVGTGHCVPFVQEASGAPETAAWKRGDRVKGNRAIQTGTAIATFGINGKYTNSLDGTSHAAIYVRQDKVGIYALDQWKNKDGSVHAVSPRCIRFQGGLAGHNAVNDGDNYYVVEVL